MKSHFVSKPSFVSSRYLLVVCLLVVSTVLCEAGNRPPLFVDPNFAASSIAQFDVYFVDLSNNGQNNSECIGGALVGTDTALWRRGYNKAGRRNEDRIHAAQTAPTEEMLSNPTHQWLQDLGDVKNMRHGKNSALEHVPTGQWTMILVLDNLGSRNNSIKGPGDAALSLYIYDRTQATLLWHDQAEKRMWGGVLGNVMQKGEIKQGTCNDLASLMVYKLPKHKK